MSIATDIVAAEIIVAPFTGEIDVVVDSHDVLVETANYEILVEPVGSPGKQGDPGPPGPTRVSADAGNIATLGTDSLIYVPLAFDEATLDARYVNGAGDTIPGLLLIDRGPGAGVPLMQFRTNNGTQVISSDASSYMTFSNGINVPILYTGGIGFTAAGAQIDMNMGTIIQASKFTTTSATGHFRNYSDYNAGQGQADQGFIHTYANRTAGGAPQAAFQVHKSGDISENPFLISSNGYGWLRNLQGNKPVLTLRGSSDQTAKVFQTEDAAGNPKMSVASDGTLYATIMRVPGIDLWNDGTIYFQAQAVSLGSTPAGITTNKDLVVGGNLSAAAIWANGQLGGTNVWADVEVGAPRGYFTESVAAPDMGANTVSAYMPPTDPAHVTRKDYVDSRIWKGTQAAYDAIPAKDPTVLYVVAG